MLSQENGFSALQNDLTLEGNLYKEFVKTLSVQSLPHIDNLNGSHVILGAIQKSTMQSDYILVFTESVFFATPTQTVWTNIITFRIVVDRPASNMPA